MDFSFPFSLFSRLFLLLVIGMYLFFSFGSIIFLFYSQSRIGFLSIFFDKEEMASQTKRRLQMKKVSNDILRGSHIEALPDKILLKILSNLRKWNGGLSGYESPYFSIKFDLFNAGQVSKRWRRLARNSIMSRMKWRKNAKITMLWCISLWNQAIWSHWRNYLTKKFCLTWIHLFSTTAKPWRIFVSAMWSLTCGTWS